MRREVIEHDGLTLGLLSAGGRFVEMGKTDVRDPARVAGLSRQSCYRLMHKHGLETC